ncbi:ABC transporter ATP-binding protein [Chlorogloea sp. CCALA 695]|uniref:ABC transporter ATP-binding protein n=1 Tax=Chlorogloea sp. CCALA 695 TaxID=2107693 RepID=UPI000D07635F|nr:ABC transporter ATP-binding protein [Chlorogloea sp. CCALA 695]PSB33970.1 MFS transporter [Chlorogloea sp. CCALA 695]
MIEVEHLSKNYGSTPGIQDISFNVEPGEIMGFLGPNGAGKTTTMRILAGYLPATAGTARIAGYDVHENSLLVRQRIGYLPETPPLYPEMTVEGFLYFVARIKGVSAGNRASAVIRAIERCNLQQKSKVLIRKLSKGFRQRVGIAQAIVHDPPVIILDEPTVGLDPRQIIDVRNLIKSLAGSHTIILSTHILPEVSMTCDRVTIINGGKVVVTNTPAGLEASLASGVGYEVEIEGEAAEAVKQLQFLLDVRLVEVTHLENKERIRTVLKVSSEPGTEPGSDIVQVLVNMGINVYEMRRTRASLEDVFLVTTEEKLETPVAKEQITPTLESNEPTSVDEITSAKEET